VLSKSPFSKPSLNIVTSTRCSLPGVLAIFQPNLAIPFLSSISLQATSARRSEAVPGPAGVKIKIEEGIGLGVGEAEIGVGVRKDTVRIMCAARVASGTVILFEPINSVPAPRTTIHTPISSTTMPIIAIVIQRGLDIL
jgi:hypothetical protein